jgi:solute carrier family 35 protein F1/2
MCQNGDSQRRSSSHNLAEYSPLLAETSVNIDVSYHSFPSPAWTKGFSQLLIKNSYDEQPSCTFRQISTAPCAIILFGQSIAVSLAMGNFAISSMDSTYDIRLPALTMGVVYLVLSLHLVLLFMRQSYFNKESWQSYNDVERSQQNSLPKDESVHFFPFTKLTLQTPWQAYLLLAILDLEANYLTMLSFQHTSLSSSMILTSLSVFSTLLFRRCVFGRTSVTYSWKKITGVFVSVVGACLWIRKDFYQSNSSSISSTGGNAIYGDLLAICSALLYGLNDVLLEYTVKSNNDRIEYLGMIGLFGSLVSFFIQAPIFESTEITELLQNFPVVNFVGGSGFLLCGFIVMMSYFYISVTVFLSSNDATILNLSLQSSPLWAVILTSLVNLGGEATSWEFPPVVFFVALAMVISGMFLYETTPVKDQ